MPKRKKVLAVGIGAAVAAAALASAAGLGGLTIEKLGAENSVVADPFSDGVNITWGTPVYDAATTQYVVDEFTVSRDATAELPVGKLRVTISDGDGDALTEATAITTGTLRAQVFTLADAISVKDIKNASLVLHDIDPDAPTYVISAAQIGTGSGAVWAASASNAAQIVADPTKGDVLELSGDGAGVQHTTADRVYPQIDNVYDAGLPWDNFFAGATNGQVDPVTGDTLQASGTAKVTAKVDAGSTLWVDLDLAHGDSVGALTVTRLTCEVSATTTWSTIDLNDCNSLIGSSLDNHWIATEGFTFEDVWLGTHTYAAGDHLSVAYGSPAVALVAGYGFHVEGSGKASIQELNFRGQTIGFAS